MQRVRTPSRHAGPGQSSHTSSFSPTPGAHQRSQKRLRDRRHGASVENYYSTHILQKEEVIRAVRSRHICVFHLADEELGLPCYTCLGGSPPDAGKADFTETVYFLFTG